MVSRKHSADSRVIRSATSLFAAWRRLLGRIALSARDTISQSTAARQARPAQRNRGGFDGPGAIAVGLACLIGGGLLGVAIAPPGPPSTAEALAALSSIAWAVVRLAIMRASVHASGGERSSITNAWALGLAPWLIGVSPGLRLITWFASAGLTWYFSVRRAISPSDARTAVVRAWGIQAAVVTVLYLLRNAAVAILAS